MRREPAGWGRRSSRRCGRSGAGAREHRRAERRRWLSSLAAIALPRTDAAALIERLGGHWDWSRKEEFRPISLADGCVSV